MLETEPRMKWHGEGETEPMEIGKLASAIMKKWKNGSHFMENHHRAKFPITTPPPQSLGICFSEC